ncbi:hypothetical protein MLD38_018515 [Melastoma candidum]|uniref:Uncharacterized protein n=1 Tax=Melastoma candidum TaxID=119954 RepID=A0ACB9QU40_9MYRT|nr:hypothetical protein MLD38_018515 [Melastoma candidum]
MAQSFKALAAAGVEGIVMEVWWGLVERDSPGVYEWKGYWDITEMARWCGLKVRVVLGFHQCGAGSEDPDCLPIFMKFLINAYESDAFGVSMVIVRFFKDSIPHWVLEEMDKNPNLAYSDRYGRRSIEYVSLGCDILPVLRGRSPIQAYADLMRNFRDAFSPFFGDVISGIQIGMGPGGELTYPLSPSQMKTRISSESVEFYCYDKVARLLGRYGFGLCCAWIELLDRETVQMNAAEAIFRQVVSAARLYDVPV